MALGCSITSIYVLVWFYQINMKRLIGCHDHIIDIISGCDYIFEKKVEMLNRQETMCA
jgi:hypothetical protein